MPRSSHDALGRRHRFTRVSTGKRVILRKRKLVWAEKIHRHGPLSSSQLHEFTRHMAVDDTFTRRLLCDLYHEDNTPHKGPYFERPWQQAQTYDADGNDCIYDLTKHGDAALKELGLWRINAPKASPLHWRHDFLLSHITASIDYATFTQSNHYEYIHHDEIVDRIGPLHFELSDSILRPDRVCGVRYRQTGGVFLFLIEADMDTEPLTSNDRNRHKTFTKNARQYEEFFKDNFYQSIFGAGASVLSITVTVNLTRMQTMQSIVQAEAPNAASRMLFKAMPQFAGYFDPPKPSTDFFTEPFSRAGKTPYLISNPVQ